MFESRHVEALVVGAGPVGLFSSLSMARCGVSPMVIDQSPRTAVHAYCAVLHPATVEVLDRAGVGEEVRSHGREVREIVLHFGEASHRIELPRESAPIVCVPQSAVERILLQALEGESVSVQWNHELTDLADQKDEVRICVSEHGDVPQGYPVLAVRRLVIRDRVMTASHVLGADGYHSAVRRLGGFSILQTAAARRFLFFEAEAEHELPPVIHLSFGPAGVASLWPMRGRGCRWTFESAVGSHGGGADAILQSLVKERAPWFEGAIARTVWNASGLFECRSVDQMSSGCLTLAGDSAHLGDPVGGHSMNAGLREAWEAGQRIAGVSNGTYDVSALAELSRQVVRQWSDLATSQAAWPGSPPAWAEEHADRVLASIPASGEARDGLLSQIGLEPVVSPR